ncbi:MAG: UDP-N-acetylmuramoyl-L-alanine--D-glutamate ligase [Phycisphaerales bacterium]
MGIGAIGIAITDAWLAGRRAVVMGLGRFGGGVGVTRFLASRGARVLVTDRGDERALRGALDEIGDLVRDGAVSLRLGEHRERDFTDADLVVANPAVPRAWEDAYLNAARAAGVPITTEIRLAFERLPDRSRVLGITGTAGKSTTSAMGAAILSGAFGAARVHLGGNIGGSLLGRIDGIGGDDFVVLELSSAQLHWLDAGAGGSEALGYAPAGLSPGVAVLTNFAPNHLDWHGSVEHYAASKRVIFAHQQAGDVALVPAIGERDRWVAQECVARVEGIAEAAREMGGALSLSVVGGHNRMNACAAIAACEALAGVERSKAIASVNAFRGLPHRLELVRVTAGGIRCINDSKCTTPEGAALAVGAFEGAGECGAGRVVLVCGGAEKGVPLDPMVGAAASCGAVLTIGATGERLAELVRSAGGRAEHAGTLEAAMSRARALRSVMAGGGVLLLSPGCASWDQFANYEQRGEAFARWCEDLD